MDITLQLQKVVNCCIQKYGFHICDKEYVEFQIYRLFYNTYRESLMEGKTLVPDDVFPFVGEWPVLQIQDTMDLESRILLPIFEASDILEPFSSNMEQFGLLETEDKFELTWVDPNPLCSDWRTYLKKGVQGANRIPHFFGTKSEEVSYHDVDLIPWYPMLYPKFVEFFYRKDTESGFPIEHLDLYPGMRAIVALSRYGDPVGAYSYYRDYRNRIHTHFIYRNMSRQWDKYSLLLGLHLALLRQFGAFCTVNFGSNPEKTQDNDYKKRHLKQLKTAPLGGWRATQ